MTQTAPLPHISDYQIVIESDPIGLGAKVDLAIHNGWQPHGSLAVNHTSDGAIYAQPMVKYAELFR